MADYTLLDLWGECSSNDVIRASRRKRKQKTTPTPTPCDINDTERAKNILAVSSYRETGGGCATIEDNDTNRPLVTAVMLMQFNNIRTRGGNIRAAGATWRGIGSLNYSTVDADTFCGGLIDQWIIDLASSMVENYCSSGDPLSSITNVDPSLVNLSTDDLALHEVSIDISQADAFKADERLPVKYLYDAPSLGRTVVVGGVEITRAFIGYQCSTTQQYTITDFPDVIRARPTNNALSGDGNYTCESNCSISAWYAFFTSENRARVAEIIGKPLDASNSSTSYVIVSAEQRRRIRQEFPGGTSDYVQACT